MYDLAVLYYTERWFCGSYFHIFSDTIVTSKYCQQVCCFNLEIPFIFLNFQNGFYADITVCITECMCKCWLEKIDRFQAQFIANTTARSSRQSSYTDTTYTNETTCRCNVQDELNQINVTEWASANTTAQQQKSSAWTANLVDSGQY